MSSKMSLGAGDRIGKYRILRPLDAGGMGQVYLAREDPPLNRDVALKILPPDLVLNEERVRRFVLEAKSASSLNHPHIVHIYEIGHASVQGASITTMIHYIAMELVQGRTLADAIHLEHADLKSLLAWLAQAADGLAKAHAAGIVHRDLKPRNIMISEDGYAKVLDFGLAKLIESTTVDSPPDMSAAVTAALEHTEQGVILGTAGYMSPEQVQGKTIDHRSDIFSFGCILYEVTTRDRPFRGDSSVEIMHKILREPPDPVEEKNPKAPAELRKLIRRCLVKDVHQRIDSMKTLSIELAELVDNYDSLTTEDRSSSGTGLDGGPIPNRKWLPRVIIGGLSVLLAAMVFGVLRVGGGSKPKPLQSEPMKVSLLLTGKTLRSAVLSPDARYLAMVALQGGKWDLVVRQIKTGSDVRILGPLDEFIWGLRFSPDGEYIYYEAFDPQDSSFNILYRIPTLGGGSSRVLYDVDSPPAFSPDAHRLAFVRHAPMVREDQLRIANVDGTRETTFVATSSPTEFGIPVWSADGKEVFVSWTRGPNTAKLLAFSFPEGKKREISSWASISDFDCLRDGRTLVVSGSPNDPSEVQLWLASVGGGEPLRITNDVNRYRSVTVAADGNSLVSLESKSRTYLWSVATKDFTSKTDLPTASSIDDKTWSLAALPGGFITFRDRSEGMSHLFLVAANGTSRKQLSPDNLNCTGNNLAVARNTGQIFFRGTETGGKERLWKLDPQSGALAALPAEGMQLFLDVSPDGQELLFGHEGAIWRTDTTGHAAVKLCQPAWYLARYSPKGDRILVGSRTQSGEIGIQIVNRDGTVLQKIELPERSASSPNFLAFAWAPSGKDISYLRFENDRSNVWNMPLSGGEPYPVTRLTTDRIRSFAWSQDGQDLYIVGGDLASDVVRIQDFQSPRIK